MNESSPSIADVLNFVNSFHEQCRNMVRDTVRLLRDKHQMYLTHAEKWDYAERPNERFLTHDYGSVRRGWTTFIPSGDIKRGALFYFEFFHPRRFVRPSLTFGAVYPGEATFDSVDRWAPYFTIIDAEKGESTVNVCHEGPIAIVTGTMPKRFEESTLIRVPLETITDQGALESIVVAPLVNLLVGARSEAIITLSGKMTELWPSLQADAIEEKQVDSEQA